MSEYRHALDGAIALQRENCAEQERRLVRDREILAGLEMARRTSEPAVRLVDAITITGMAERTLRRRAQSGAGYKLSENGPWFFPQSYIDALCKPDIRGHKNGK